MNPRWVAKSAVLMCALLVISAGILFAALKESETNGRMLLQSLALLEVGRSTAADVRLVEQSFRRYQVADEQTGDVHVVRFMITNQPIPKLKLGPMAALIAEIGVQDGKVVAVDVTLERQVGVGSRAARIHSSLQPHIGFCKEPYCVGNPIGKPYVVSRLDARATPEQKRRAFNLNLNWLSRFRGEPRICDLAPDAWRDWKDQAPDQVTALEQTYHCR